MNLRSKTQRRAKLLLPTWICSRQSVGTVNFALPFTTSVTISISILQTFRIWEATSHLRPPMAYLSHNSSDTPGLAPLMNVLFWGRRDFPISFSGRDMSRNVWNRLLGSSMVGTGILLNHMRSPLFRMLRDILDDDHIQWHPPLLGHDTYLWPLLIWTLLPNMTFYLIVQGFHRTYATGAACQQRTLTPPDTWSCPTLGLACVLMSRPISPELVLSPDFWISNIPRYFSFALSAE